MAYITFVYLLICSVMFLCMLSVLFAVQTVNLCKGRTTVERFSKRAKRQNTTPLLNNDKGKLADT